MEHGFLSLERLVERLLSRRQHDFPPFWPAPASQPFRGLSSRSTSGSYCCRLYVFGLYSAVHADGSALGRRPFSSCVPAPLDASLTAPLGSIDMCTSFLDAATTPSQDGCVSEQRSFFSMALHGESRALSRLLRTIAALAWTEPTSSHPTPLTRDCMAGPAPLSNQAAKYAASDLFPSAPRRGHLGSVARQFIDAACSQHHHHYYISHAKQPCMPSSPRQAAHVSAIIHQPPTSWILPLPVPDESRGVLSCRQEL